MGVMLEALKAGFHQNEISSLNIQRKSDVARCRRVIVGTNRYLEEEREKNYSKNQTCSESIFQKHKDLKHYRLSRDNQKWKSSLKQLSLSLDSTEFEVISGGTEAFLNHSTLGEVSSMLHRGEKESISVERIEIYRASQMFEELRANLDRHRIKNRFNPKVFLIPYGEILEYREKVNFSQEFFRVAGFEVIDPGEPKEIYEMVGSVLHTYAQIVVICSADHISPEIIPIVTEFLKQRKPEIIVVLAGDPKDNLEKFKQCGIEEFIYHGVDVYQVLKKLMRKIGIY
jgi:methylmalonyl-CoA mutase